MGAKKSKSGVLPLGGNTIAQYVEQGSDQLRQLRFVTLVNVFIYVFYVAESAILVS